MTLLIESDNNKHTLSDNLCKAFGIPLTITPAKDIYKADAILLMWNGKDKNKQRIKETAIKLRKPIYEILTEREGTEFENTRHIRRLPTLK